MSHSRVLRPRPRGAPGDAADRADLTGVLLGDERAFERLVERHHGRLLVLAAAHGATGEAARQALLRTWSAFLDTAAAAEPDVRVRALVTALLLDELPRPS